MSVETAAAVALTIGTIALVVAAIAVAGVVWIALQLGAAHKPRTVEKIAEPVFEPSPIIRQPAIPATPYVASPPTIMPSKLQSPPIPKGGFGSKV